MSEGGQSPPEPRSSRIGAAISELPACERDAILSVFSGKYSYREAARMLCVPPVILKSRVRTGLLELHRSLDEKRD